MFMRILIRVIVSNLTNKVISSILDEIANSSKNKITEVDTIKLKKLL